jgi:hypothetical protein
VDLVAYLDESRKPVRDPATGNVAGGFEHYVVAAAVVFGEDADAVRESVRGIERDLGFALHYGELRSRARRLAVVDAIVALPDWDGYVFETARAVDVRRRSEHAIRAAILTEAFPTLEGEAGVGRIVLESRAMPTGTLGPIDKKDLDALRRLRIGGRVAYSLQVGHAPKFEAIVAIPDIIAGARSDFICGADRSIYPRLAHRVRGAVHRVSV